ncbi:conserved hypothetical protein (plasmid) [Thioalkalivibrio sp. K90mix]|uniref:hypothetical protein n=1 Tax=Thioalkalivibrio sp. (strain K90mix) TaxID=396595 RepID=UPI000195AB1B|nr:hypothetical protein [Thioalkalivibrio sp. K90mix]ADC73096.1 conserved hypothetical protein [Thioalkalivibrio sp. K90mix]
MTERESKLVYYAMAPRAYAGTISVIEDGDFRSYWVPKLRGKIVCLDRNRFKFDQKQAALEEARAFRESCRQEAREAGLIH